MKEWKENIDKLGKVLFKKQQVTRKKVWKKVAKD